MLQTKGPLEVWCETYDDIVLVWGGQNDAEEYEFVQVKAENLNQLWTPARLTARDSKKKGTSVLERSLVRDCCIETSKFRLITTRQVSNELECLTLPRNHEQRRESSEKMVALSENIGGAVGDFLSAKSNGHSYWLAQVEWEHHTRESIEQSNRLLLIEFLQKEDLGYFPDIIEGVYQDLLTLVKTAAEIPWAHQQKKMIGRAVFREFILKAVDPYPNVGPMKKLEEKLAEAGLDSADIQTAKELNRQFVARYRDPSYLDLGMRGELATGVLARLLSLRAKLNSGQLAQNGVKFHASCLEDVQQYVSQKASGENVPAGFAEGCMYNITSRCSHKFAKARL